MKNETKKTIVIIVLSLIIVGLIIFIILPGDGDLETIIESLQNERIGLIRSNEIIKSELTRSISEVTELEKDYRQLESDNIDLQDNNIELTNIIGKITAGSKETENYLTEYGRINNDFAEYLRSATITE